MAIENECPKHQVPYDRDVAGPIHPCPKCRDERWIALMEASDAKQVEYGGDTIKMLLKQAGILNIDCSPEVYKYWWYRAPPLTKALNPKHGPIPFQGQYAGIHLRHDPNLPAGVLLRAVYKDGTTQDFYGSEI